MESSIFEQLFIKMNRQRGLLFGVMILLALLAFEIFNYSTTDYALADLVGKLEFAGVRWSTILAIAFCGIDFAGIARLFTPQFNGEEMTETWYLFAAWLLAATMNAMLTWWGVSLAVLNHETLGNAVIDRTMLLRVVPIFVAVMVWLIRVLIIGTFSQAGERLFSQGILRATPQQQQAYPARPAERASRPSYQPISTPVFRPAPKTAASFKSERQYEPVSTMPDERGNYSQF